MKNSEKTELLKIGWVMWILLQSHLKYEERKEVHGNLKLKFLYDKCEHVKNNFAHFPQLLLNLLWLLIYGCYS